jgi:enoyl-CoA hydratase
MHFLKNARRYSMVSETTDVLFSEVAGHGGDLGIITLNRPQALNAINHHMIQNMHAQLRKWAVAPNIKAVIIRAVEGRAFCAGGDLRLTYERCREHNPAMTNFFQEEYELNHAIFHYPKPYIALLDGITMGGGVGISIHGSHRVATNRLLFAMPETGIGFFPDVGGTYFLPRLSGHMGFYLGLVGARIKSDDCVHLGIAQHKVPHHCLSDLIESLANCLFGHDARADVTRVIQQFSEQAQASTLLAEQKHIDHVFSQPTMETIIEALHQTNHHFAKEAWDHLQKKSPTSLKVSLQALQLGATLNFDSCMQQEYRLATRFLLGHDFVEGIRAVIIDKDQQPRWQPDTLADVSDTDVKKYFSPLPKELFQ